MKMRNTSLFGILAAVLLAGFMPLATAWGVSVKPGKFLGLFIHTESRMPLAQQTTQIERLLQSNPYLKGLTIRLPWKDAEPEQGRFDWSALDRMIAIARARHIYYTVDPIAGSLTPDWVYGRGVKRFESTIMNPHLRSYGQAQSQPVPWDSTYRSLYRNFLTKFAERYGNDPSLLEVTINGHNTQVEMIMPHTPQDMEQWRQSGWSSELVESDWKGWIDFFAQTFPNTNIGLMLSNMYDKSTQPLVGELASYAVRKYANHLILMTAALYGRRDQSYLFQTHIVLKYPQVPNADETIGSFKRDPQRQGSMAMFIYNMRELSPVFVRLWPADAQDVQQCSTIVSQYQQAQSMSLASLRSELESKQLYTTVDTYQGPSSESGGPNQMGRFGGRRRPWMSRLGNGSSSQ